jgi:hypothetical protein
MPPERTEELLAEHHATAGMWLSYQRLNRAGLRQAQESVRPIFERAALVRSYRGIPVVRLDPSAFPQRMPMAARISSFDTWDGQLMLDGGELIELADIRSVWHRRASQFVMDERMSAPERAFAYGEARRGLGGVFAALGRCLWVNDPMAAARAEYKPVQLAAAADAGLRIPETLITSDPRSAHDWARQLGRRSSTSRSQASGTPMRGSFG